MALSNVRIGGSGYTVFAWRGTTLAYLQTIQDQPPQPVGRVEAIQPIDHEVPIEIVTPMAVGPGRLSLRFYELWNSPAWSHLPGLEGTNNLLDVFKRQVQLGEITCRKVIKNPRGGYRVKVYHGCVVVDIDEGETVSIDTMTLPKTLSIQYTHTTSV